jgi:hypothetical protein
MANPIAAKLVPMDILKDRQVVKNLVAAAVRFYRHRKLGALHLVLKIMAALCAAPLILSWEVGI